MGFGLCIATKDFPRLLFTGKSPTRRVGRGLIEPLPGMIHRKGTLVGVKKWRMGLDIGARYPLRKSQIISWLGCIVKSHVYISKGRQNNGGVVVRVSSQDQECFKLERHRRPKDHPYTQETCPSELRTSQLKGLAGLYLTRLQIFLYRQSERFRVHFMGIWAISMDEQNDKGAYSFTPLLV